MRTRTAAFFLAAAVASSCPAGVLAAPVGDAAPVATLTVTGRAQISRPPDLATVAVTIVTNDDSAARSLAQNNARFNALSAKVAATGIAAGDIVSASLSSYFNPRPAMPAASTTGQLFGYVVTREVALRVAALGTIGSVVDAATAAGVSQINGVTYGFRDRRVVERAALAAAVNDAYLQAQTLAAAAHVQIVRILHIGDDAAPPGRAPAVAAMMRTQESVPTVITPSDQDVTSSVAVTYLIR